LAVAVAEVWDAGVALAAAAFHRESMHPPPGGGDFTWQIPPATAAHAGVTLAVSVGRDARGGRAS